MAKKDQRILFAISSEHKEMLWKAADARGITLTSLIELRLKKFYKKERVVYE